MTSFILFKLFFQLGLIDVSICIHHTIKKYFATAFNCTLEKHRITPTKLHEKTLKFYANDRQLFLAFNSIVIHFIFFCSSGITHEPSSQPCPMEKEIICISRQQREGWRRKKNTTRKKIISSNRKKHTRPRRLILFLKLNFNFTC